MEGLFEKRHNGRQSGPREIGANVAEAKYQDNLSIHIPLPLLFRLFRVWRPCSGKNDRVCQENLYGYTVACTPDAPITGIPHTRAVTYNPQKDFSSIIMFYSQGGVIAVRSDSAFKKMQDLIDLARKNPGKLTMGIAGTGNNVHLGVIQIEKHDKTRFQYVPFEGSGPTTTGLLGGHVMGASCTLAPLIPHVKAGTVRLLLALDKERLDEFPDVPTADEIGYPPAVTDIVGIKGILTVRKAVPQPIKNRLIDAFSEVARSPEYRKLAFQNGLTVPEPPLTGEKLDKYLYELSELARETIGQIGLQKK